ncbi:APC family permease [Agrococcus terreus]|uniref:DNA-binding protein n=1 Tax=Agrococcus terreus TaxID=574649 RepID=A0ABQ2KNS7_9MICO|nr:APC family permease [Agrococcus terreus]GGN88830.1 DNA-binding protein [Agrococcus terreus]
MTNAFSPKRILLGKPLESDRADGQLLPKRIALPVFASDALSSVAYGPQEMFLILTIGGLAVLAHAPWVALGVLCLIAIVVAGSFQLVRAYPSGGGDYEVAHRNLGPRAGLVVGSALLIDYVLTVAVSVASGVDNVISAFPALGPFRVELAVALIALLAAANLRGVRESGTAFAIPTYVFIGSVVLLIGTGLVRTALGDPPVAESSGYAVEGDPLTQAGLALLLLRAFASGCSALTGIEAISNGVPAFRQPKVRNARITLLLMGGISMTLFAGITALGVIAKVHYAEDPCDLVGYADCASVPQQSVIAQLGTAVFGGGSPLFFLLTIATALVLMLAANTAFNGFPLLGSVLAANGYAPKSLQTRGDRLVHSNGVILLALGAALLVLAFQADLNALIQLYIIGVFVSFSFGQIGMVVHWRRLLRSKRRSEFQPVPFAINLVSAVCTSSVLVVVTVTKFAHGAWLVFLIGPVLWWLMFRIHRYYGRVRDEIAADRTTQFGAKGDHAIVLVGELSKPTLKALDYAIAARHESLEAVHADIDPEATKRLQKAWRQSGIRVPLRIAPSPYRDISVPVIEHIERHRAEHGPEVVTVYTPKYVGLRWWERILHNHKSARIRHKLMLVHGVTLALVPWQLHPDRPIAPSARPLPGEARRGEPRRPVVRRRHERHATRR